MAGGLNLYAYAANAPGSFIDPLGLAIEDCLAGTSSGLKGGVVGGLVFRAVAVLFGSAAATTLGAVSLGALPLMLPGPGDPCLTSNEWHEKACELAAGTAAAAAVGGGGTRGKGRANEPRSTLPRDAAGNYLPDPKAQGPHSTIGVRIGRDRVPYRQGATFDENGNFLGRTDVSNHGRADHSNPHFHPATGPNSVDSKSVAIPEAP